MKTSWLLIILLMPLLLCARPGNPLTEAQQLYDEGKYTECIAKCDEALATRFMQAATYLLRGKAHIELSLYALAIEDLDASIQRDQKNAQAYALRGYCYYQLNDYRPAWLSLIEASYIDRTSALYLYNLGNVEQRMLKTSEAIRSYTAAIKLKPEYAEAYINRGHIYLARNEFTLAIRDLDSAIKYKQHSGELFLYRGMALTSLKRYPEAIDMFSRCIRLKPADAAASYNRGRVYYQMHNFKQAVADFDTAIVLKPAMEIAYFNRALTLLELNRESRIKACADLNKAVELGYIDALTYLKKYCE